MRPLRITLPPMFAARRGGVFSPERGKRSPNMAIPNGAHVRQLVVPIDGVVAERRFSDEDDQMHYRVDTETEGGVASRWFLESQIEVVQ